MRQLLGILGDSTVIWSRNFTLTYVLLFLPLLLNILLPEGGISSPDWRIGLLFLVILLLVSAVLAGWFAMIAKACTRYLDQPVQISAAPEDSGREPVSPVEAFTLFREFLPGIAAHFVQFSVGALIQGGVLALLGVLLYPAWLKNESLFKHLFKMAAEGQKTLPPMTLAQQQSFSEFSLLLILALFGYGIFWLATLLWPVFVTFYGDNAIKACWRSFTRFLRDPLRLLALSGLFLLAQLLPILGLGSGVFLLALLFQFGGLLMEIYVYIALFVYAYHAIGKPVPPATEEGDKAMSGTE